MVIAVAAQFAASSSPTGMAFPYSRLLAGCVFVGLLLLGNALAFAEQHTTVSGRRRQLALSQLVVDIGLAVAIYWVFLFDPASPVWALIMAAVVEAAVRYRLRGALVVWAIGSVSLIAGEFYAAAFFPGAEVSVSRFILRVTVILMVAFACGALAESLTRQIRRERRANEAAERRAGLLATVTDAARRMSSLDPTQVLEHIVDAAMEVGFEAGEICLLDEAGGRWKSLHPRGLPGRRAGGVQPVDAGVAGLVHQQRETVVVADYSSWSGALPDVAELGFRSVIAAPVWSGTDLEAVLTVATVRTELLAEEREAIELLAAQASRALEIAHRYRERETLQRQLTHQAFHDALTGLPNRPLFRDRLDQAIARSAREQGGIALLFVDLDGFKLVNDTLGHHAGDDLLIQIAARLTTSVRPGDTVARLGGDEFVVLVERIARVEEALMVAERILASVDQPVEIGGSQTMVSASIGISWAGGSSDAVPEQLLQEADRAMYRAKERGKGVIEVYEAGFDDRHEHRVQLESDLRRAIVEEAIDLAYQPMLNADGSRVVAVEALARWDHPVRGPVSPGEFIPLAERSGAIVPLGRYLLHKALRQAARWRTLPDPPRLNVNVSIRQLEEPGFPEMLRSALATTKVPPEMLVLELTEATAVEDSPRLLGAISAVKALGVEFAVDDFGAGFSSLRYLRDLPVQEVKLDRSLIVGMTTIVEDRAIVRWVTQLAHELGMRVTVEGVETAEQWRVARELDCDIIQGFLLHRPLPCAQLDIALGLPTGDLDTTERQLMTTDSSLRL